MIKKAARQEIDISDWKARFIGEPIDPENLIKIIKKYTR